MRANAPQLSLSSEAVTVLVVDDSASQRYLLSAALKKAGYHVLAAACAADALEICASAEISIILSDWSMPGMDGPAFCRQLRQVADTYIYFILMTSRGDKSERALGLDSGADDFVTRPIDWVELRARLRSGERILTLQKETRDKQNMAEMALSELQELHAALDQDLLEARKLQQSLIPPPYLEKPAYDIASRLLPCGHVGGDLVGYFDLSDGNIAIYSIDVSGHGVASALLTGRLSGLFGSNDPARSIVYSRWLDGEIHLDPPHMVVARLNRLMLSELDTDIYFTCVLAYLHLPTGKLRLCQAGHPPPFIKGAKGVRSIGDGGPPVGLLPDMVYTEITLNLERDEQIILYSDGVTELENPDGRHLGEEGLRDILHKAQTRNSHEATNAIEIELLKHAEGRAFGDDISLLALHYKK